MLFKIFFLIVITWVNNALATIDPLSKITITSERAICSKSIKHPGYFVFLYKNNVCATLADQSMVTADTLKVVFNAKGMGSNQKIDINHSQAPSPFKQIIFKNNVCITNAQRKATARTATVHLAKKQCVLEGDVKIFQTKQQPKDIPVVIASSKASLSLDTGQLELFGDKQKPVHTTIILEGHPSFDKKQKGVVQQQSHDQKNSNSSTTRSS